MTTTTAELAKFIGKTGLWRVGGGGILVAVSVKDVRKNYGRIDLLIKPLSGQGETWVDSESVESLDSP
jgi:hypothetical protein